MKIISEIPQCLVHQLPEDQHSLHGCVCVRCKHRIYTTPPSGRVRKFWESQPQAFDLFRNPCFVYRRQWDDFTIRSLIIGGQTNDIWELLET